MAHILGAVYRGTYYALKTSYDEAYRAWSPGIVLFRHAIRKAFEDGLATFDFLGADSRWKSELANDARLHVDACAFAGSAWRCRWDRVRVGRVKPFLEAPGPRSGGPAPPGPRPIRRELPKPGTRPGSAARAPGRRRKARIARYWPSPSRPASAITFSPAPLPR